MRNKSKRNEVMKNLRFGDGIKLQEIANKYGISRERVRQVVGNSYGLARKIRSNKEKEIVLAHPEMTNEQLSKFTGLGIGKISTLRSGTRHKIDSGGTALLGRDAENYVSGVLNNKGIKHKLMPYRHRFDILLENGKTADVKSTYVLSTPDSRKHSVYVFHKQGGIKQADFYICIIMKTKDVFVIPHQDVPKASMIVFPWPPKMNRSKYGKYHNRFDLLRGEYE